MMKFQIPNSKIQINSKFQIPVVGIWCLVLGVFLSVALIPLPAAAVTFINCGAETRDPANNQITAVDQCDFNDLLVTIITLINYLISVAAVIAMYQVLLGGFNFITALGNPEKIKTSRTHITNAIVGFGIVVLAFVFVNLLANGIFGQPGASRPWWDPKCVYNISGTTNPQTPPAAPDCPLNQTLP